MTIFLKSTIIFSINLLFMFSLTHSQSGKQQDHKTDRKPAVAGSFYSADRSSLQSTIEGYFNNTEIATPSTPLAVIVPHAGYVFSGQVAAASYKQIDRDKQFDRVFIIGSSHTTYFKGASIYTQGDFITPLGNVVVDPLAADLVKEYDFINNDIKPHSREHSLEVQLPFLQYWLNKPFTIVPVVIGGDSRETCKKLADALKPYLNSKNLFIISTDFSHYPNYADAKRSDIYMADAIITNSSDKFLKAKSQMEGMKMSNLATAMCGWTSVLTLLNLTENINGITYKKLMYRNSGDSDYGEKNRVVGYYALCVLKSDEAKSGIPFDLSEQDKIQLLSLARNTIESYILNNTFPEINENEVRYNNRNQLGAFVTLMKQGELRGCIGHIYSEEPLYKTIQTMAVASATRDYRFQPLDASELKEIEIEISVLSPMHRIKSLEEIELGRHGIYIRKGYHTGTFLPQVAEETNWTREEFVSRCARDKANIGWDGWKDAELYVYEALKFSEQDFNEGLK